MLSRALLLISHSGKYHLASSFDSLNLYSILSFAPVGISVPMMEKVNQIAKKLSRLYYSLIEGSRDLTLKVRVTWRITALV